MNTQTRTIWTFAITSIALFMVTLDNLVVSTALPVIRDRPRRVARELEWTVNAYTLTFAVLPPDRRRARRPLRPPAHVRRSASAIFTLALGRRPRSRRSIEALDRRPRRAGLGGAIVMPLTLTILSARGPAGEARRRARRLGRDRRPRRRPRPARRRRRRRRASRGSGSSGSTCRSDRPVPLALRACSESHGPRRQLDLPGLGARQRRPVRHRLGPRPRQRRRLGRARRSSARSRSAPRSSPRSWLGAAHAPQPMLPMRFFRKPRVRARQRRLAVHVLRHVRLDLPALAVLPDRAGLLAARGRAADAAVDARCRCSSPRSPARSPTGSAAGRCSAAGSRCRRSALGWIAAVSDADVGLLVS